MLLLFDECIMCYHEVSVNYGNSSCDERTYQPYGASVNYLGNSSCDECTYQAYVYGAPVKLILYVMNIRTSLIWISSKLML